MNYSTLKTNSILTTYYLLLTTYYLLLLSTFYLLLLTSTYFYLLLLTSTYFKFLLFKPANVSKYLFSLELKLNSISCNKSFFLQNYPILYLISAHIPKKQAITSLSLPLFETSLQMNYTTAFLLTLKSPIVFLYTSSV